MVGDRMVGSWSEVKRGMRAGREAEFMTERRSEEPRPEGIRVLVVARKSRNGDGAKEDRKVEA